MVVGELKAASAVLDQIALPPRRAAWLQLTS